ncbi:hypothetical protein L9G15_01995 [Shewanella sp. A3A]|nr:hypothetical protein [Shewanella ferrihydritica]
MSQIVEFLASISQQELKHLPLSVYKDGSAPDIDGCVFETGSGYFFELQQNGAKLEVIAGQYSIL